MLLHLHAQVAYFIDRVRSYEANTCSLRVQESDSRVIEAAWVSHLLRSYTDDGFPVLLAGLFVDFSYWLLTVTSLQETSTLCRSWIDSAMRA
jgi:hypothetical protein